MQYNTTIDETTSQKKSIETVEGVFGKTAVQFTADTGVGKLRVVNSDISTLAGQSKKNVG